MSTQKELVIEKVKTIVERLIVSLTKAGIEYFKGNPTAEISHIKDNVIVSLIDEDNIEINCFLNQNLRNGKTYFYINKQTLLNPHHDITFFVESQVKKIQEEINEDSAFTLNLERVSKLRKDKHYAVALVFLVSAFESIVSEMFYRKNHTWFLTQIIISNNLNVPELIKKYGLKYGEIRDKREILFEHEIDGEKWVISRNSIPILNKWLSIRVWEYIFKSCKRIGVYDEYILRLMGNKLMEIRSFDILESVLRESQNSNRGINFQSLSSKNGVNWAFKRFFTIDLEQMKRETQFFGEIIKKRHNIIHGSLRDDEIDDKEVEEAQVSLKKIVDFLRQGVNEKENLYYMIGVFFR